MRHTTSLLVLALIASPAFLSAQKKEDFLQIQRDLATLEEQVRQMQKTQDEKIDGLKTLLQQAVEASNRTSASLATIQRSLSEAMAEQQKALVDRVVPLSAKVDSMSNDFGSVASAVQELSKQVGRLDAKLNDILTAVTAQKEPVPPPAPVVPPGGAAGNSLTPAISAVSLRQGAEKDFYSGKDDLAMGEFVNYVNLFPEDAYAPVAQYHIGELYDRAKQYDDAAKAFDAVVERFQPNEKTGDAAFMKAMELMKAGHRTDAGEEFRNFIRTYPGNENIAKAQAHLKEMGLSAPTGSRNNAKSKKK